MLVLKGRWVGRGREMGHLTYLSGSTKECANTHLCHYRYKNNQSKQNYLDSSWNVMAHGNIWEGKWKGNWRMQWVASTLHTSSEHGVSSITTADAYTSAASSRLNWRPSRFKWTRPFRRKTKFGFCVCAITFQLASTAQENQLHVSATVVIYRLITKRERKMYNI